MMQLQPVHKESIESQSETVSAKAVRLLSRKWNSCTYLALFARTASASSRAMPASKIFQESFDAEILAD